MIGRGEIRVTALSDRARYINDRDVPRVCLSIELFKGQARIY